VQVKNKNDLQNIQLEIKTVLRERHKLDLREKEDDFTIQNMYEVINAETKTNNSFLFLILSVSGLSLLVGSVGILAVMLLSVKERTSEIGLRIAVGAKSKDILIQFLLEAVILSSLGGLLGILGGVSGTFIINLISDLNCQITLLSVLISLIVSMFIGIFSGVYPARKASTVQPITALNSN
jgi:putative ABC transport system permease protein